MLIELVQDRAQWNRAILELGGSLFQSWEWGELRRRAGWIPWRVSLETGGSVQAALQILERRLPLLPVSLMYAPRAILPGKASTEALGDLVQWLRRFLRDRRALLLRVDPPVLDGDSARTGLLTSLGFHSLPDQWSVWGNLPRANMLLNLDLPEDVLFRRMRKSHRQLVAGAVKKGVCFEAGTDITMLERFYAVLVKTGIRRGFAVRDFDYFLKLREVFLQNEAGRVFLGLHSGRAVACHLCVLFGDTCYSLNAGLDREVQGIHPNEALYWRVIQWAKEIGCREFNMLGAGTPYPPREGSGGYGLYNFKKGFGAELHYYAGYFDLPISASGYGLFRFLEQHFGGPPFRAFVRMQGALRQLTGRPKSA
jgi:lipid II:glycine glycyltransferase (peptidoglycan interpeptide bridge formation enzyme)